MITETIQNTLKLLQPPLSLTVSEWSNQFRVLSPESSAEVGRWHTDRTPYLKEIMDSFNDPTVEEIVFMKSAQIGGTEAILNCLGYIIDCAPASVLYINPTITMSESVSKERISPMLRDCPTLTDKVKEPRSRDSSNTTLSKKFLGGALNLAGSNSPASLASRPVKYIIADEIDRWALDCGQEGSPLALTRKRTQTYFDRKHFICSTPTVKGSSVIEEEYLKSDQRKYYIPCKYCNHEQILKWSNVIFKDANGNLIKPFYECEHCKQHLTDNEIKVKGTWKATAQFTNAAGFWLNELYSPWSTMQKMVDDFMKSKGNKELLRTFVNVSLAETWEETADKTDPSPLYERREIFNNVIPSDAVVITAGVDVQDDRLAVIITAWGDNEECFVIDYKTILGLLSTPEVWQKLDILLQKKYTHASGTILNIAAAFIDSGGHYTTAVYDFCRDKENRLVYPIKGSSKTGQPLQSIATNRNANGVRLVHIGTDTAKALIYSRLKLNDVGSGYIHFSDTLNHNFFTELTAEYLSIVKRAGRDTRVWKSTGRNEAIDCFVYSLAAVNMLDPDYEWLKNNLIQQPTGEIKTEQQKEQIRPQQKLNIINNNSGWGTAQRW